jgi:mannose-6-phosphate isomerase-like protein (cupin superfamily)
MGKGIWHVLEGEIDVAVEDGQLHLGSDDAVVLAAGT